jgi:hypothetical protein
VPDDPAEPASDFAREVTRALTAAAGHVVLGVYLHGSAVLGDWSPGTSDVDILVIVEDGLSRPDTDRIHAALCADRVCAGAGLEASVVLADAAAAPASPWPFVLHATGAPDHCQVVWGRSDGGDPDLILHYAVAREFGRAMHGPSPRTGGEWALERAIEPGFVRRALTDRRAGASTPRPRNGSPVWPPDSARDQGAGVAGSSAAGGTGSPGAGRVFGAGVVNAAMRGSSASTSMSSVDAPSTRAWKR